MSEACVAERKPATKRKPAIDRKSESGRSGRELLIASKAFAHEDRATSWWHLWSTLVLLVTLLGLAASPLPLYICIPASFLGGLVLIRMFIVFHDFMHGAVLRNSIVAKTVMNAFGMLMLTPALDWKHSHDDHHKHNCDDFGATLGSFPVMTTDEYAKASWWGQLGYRIVRNPIIILLGYLTTFFWGNLSNFIAHPIKNRECGLSILCHVGLVVVVGMYSIKALILAILAPMLMSCCMGAYLFYAQHNFPGMKRKKGREWDYVYAALRSSSYMKMSKLMHWFTGNIGYHHVHHLNAKIPFYRLPEAMESLDELRSPVSTTLKPADVLHCLRLKLWDPIGERLLTFKEAKQLELARQN